MASVLANWGGYYPQRVYLTEARRMGLALRPPHANHSQTQFSVVRAGGETALYMGLDQVRDLTRRTQARILRGRPFQSLADFVVRADPRPQEAENLARCGGLDGFGNRPSLLRQLAGGAQPVAQLALFDFPDAQEEDWSLRERAEAEEAVLGVGVSAHPLELRAKEVEAAGALTTVDAAGKLGQRVRVAGVRQAWRRTAFGPGEVVYLMSLEDLEGLLEVVIESNVYRRDRAALAGHEPLVVEGQVELDADVGEPTVRAERIWKVP
jgi:DNA polymerase III alpha subunit